jgi:hypothetical protein
MKKLLYLLLLTPIIYLASCSSGKGDLTPEPLPIEETIVGVTWQLLNVGGGWFRLNEDYTYSTKDYLCDTFAIEGTWSLDGDIISNTYFIGAAQFVERSTIIQYSDSLLKFQADTTPTADVYIWFEACVPEPIRGCMDSTFLNFNSNAQCPDTCMNDPVYGCMNVDALNYDVTANIDDGSCCYVEGCMDATALNYNANACQDDGSCCYIGGCMDATALNYDPSACQDDGSCCYIGGCMDATALNYDPSACQDDGSCVAVVIGDFHQGGIVFYLDGYGGGLVAAPSDQSNSAEWGCFGTNTFVGGCTNQNTINILAVCSEPNIAAAICENLNLNGYNDWFLPCDDNCNKMWLNIGQGNALGLGNIGNFSNTNYWSSREFENNFSYGFWFGSSPPIGYGGHSNEFLKDNLFYVRAIRAF